MFRTIGYYHAVNLKRLLPKQTPRHLRCSGSRIDFGERFNTGKAAGRIGNLVNNFRFSIVGD